MIKIKKLLASALILSTSLVAVSCSTTKSNLDPKTVLGEVNGQQITLEDVDTELIGYIDYLKEEFGDNFESKIDEQTKVYLNSERATVLNQLIQEKVLLKKAEELNLVPEESELNSKIEENIKELTEFYGGEDELDAAKKQYGYTDDTFNEFIKSQIIQETVVDYVTKDITVSDDEINTFYEENKEKYFTQQIGANAKHILFETEEEAIKCKEEIDAKEITFEEAFEKYSENKMQNLKPLSEDLGFVEYEQANFDTDFLTGFKKVKEGEVSDPVKSSFGYHLIKVSGITNEPTITPLNDVKEAILNQISYEKKFEKYQNQLIEWKDEMNVKITASAIGYEPQND